MKIDKCKLIRLVRTARDYDTFTTMLLLNAHLNDSGTELAYDNDVLRLLADTFIPGSVDVHIDALKYERLDSADKMLVSLTREEYDRLCRVDNDFYYITHGMLVGSKLSESGDNLDYSDTAELNRRLRQRLTADYVGRIDDLRSGEVKDR